ncbi:GNAT family N-acetyltransferase [Salinisphaera sp. USBA-960]|uniref:GNAT family N-acetyltransferase n=1 Tax=Salinisphaera orenii TaxID=856731 RepID=UPI000DBE77D9|nr:GNAT family N-acetyltransferase [Salifodinibacter halophilus]NNC25425.1 GNAT family N-acetyltransferase [Salifodinibacter halophilus]
MADLVIRPAGRDDVPTLLGLIRELAEYERALNEVVADETTLATALFDSSATAYARVAEREGVVAGFVVYFYTFSTWLGRYGLYLEDLYVTPALRGHGVGRALLTDLAGIAVAGGCRRVEWQVLNWNKPAIDFYEAIGARPQSDWTTYRLTEPALSALAEGAKS